MKTISRRELYNMIWSKTKTKTAVELGIPLAYLTTICQEHNIPTPSSSYWQRLSWGQDVEKTPLPDLEADTMIELNPEAPVIKCRKPSRSLHAKYSDILDAVLSKEQEEKLHKYLRWKAKGGKFIIDFQKPANTWSAEVGTVVKLFPVPEVLKTRREIVLQTKAYLRLLRLPGYQQTQHPDYHKLQTHLDIRVGEDLHDRVLKLFDAIINVFEALGGKMRYDQSHTSVCFADVEISIYISERTKRVELSEDERHYGNRYKFVPSGMLRVSLAEGWRSETIDDSPNVKVEDKIEVIVKKCLSVVQRELDWREQRRLEEIERIKLEEERRKEEENRRKLEKQKEDERNRVRGMFSLLKREMIVGLIDDVMSRYHETDSSPIMNTEAESHIIKLKSLKNLFAMHHTFPLESILSESDIDSLASEFFDA